jgi:hypothetical protein
MLCLISLFPQAPQYTFRVLHILYTDNVVPAIAANEYKICSNFKVRDPTEAEQGRRLRKRRPVCPFFTAMLVFFVCPYRGKDDITFFSKTLTVLNRLGCKTFSPYSVITSKRTSI